MAKKDAVAALVPQAEIDGDMGEAQMGLQARLMSQAMRKLTGIISKSKATVIFITYDKWSDSAFSDMLEGARPGLWFSRAEF